MLTASSYAFPRAFTVTTCASLVGRAQCLFAGWLQINDTRAIAREALGSVQVAKKWSESVVLYLHACFLLLLCP